ncbi:MAG: nucleotidyltransferase domain-containing protein [Nitrococcus mobilis]|nr:nucleotidyltransferase domain-containing protein [Nitrococcus mobilis]
MTAAVKQPYGLPPHVLEQLKAVFRAWPRIERVILYGSRAKGNYRKGSDIDLCLEGQALEVADLLKLDAQIDDLLLPWKFDLSLRQMIDNPNLLAHIERVGVPIYSAE